MKKLLIFIVAINYCNISFSQIEKGTVLLDGNTNINFSSTSVVSTNPSSIEDSYEGESESVFNLGLNGAYFLIDGLAAGLQISYSSISQKYSDPEDDYSARSSINSIMIAPTLRYYFSDIGLWAQASYGFGALTFVDKYSGEGETETEKVSNGMSSLDIRAGYAIFIGDKVSLNPSLGYSLQTSKFEYDEDIRITRGGLNLNFGIALHL